MWKEKQTKDTHRKIDNLPYVNFLNDHDLLNLSPCNKFQHELMNKIYYIGKTTCMESNSL